MKLKNYYNLPIIRGRWYCPYLFKIGIGQSIPEFSIFKNINKYLVGIKLFHFTSRWNLAENSKYKNIYGISYSRHFSYVYDISTHVFLILTVYCHIGVEYLPLWFKNYSFYLPLNSFIILFNENILTWCKNYCNNINLNCYSRLVFYKILKIIKCKIDFCKRQCNVSRGFKVK